MARRFTTKIVALLLLLIDHSSSVAEGREGNRLSQNSHVKRQTSSCSCSKVLRTLEAIEAIEARVAALESKGDSFFKTAQPLDCPAGFTYSLDGNRCYKAITSKLTWDQARARCAREAPGAQLATVTDWGKNVAVSKLIDSVTLLDKQNSCLENYWLAGRGIVDNDCSSGYSWQPSGNTSVPFGFTDWFWGEPNCEMRRDVESCVHTTSRVRDGRYAWNDIRCTHFMCSICEYGP